MKAIISRTLNGAWVRFVDKTEESCNQTADFSYQFESDRSDPDLEGLSSMLFELLERMGWNLDSRSREMIQIRVAHGSKFEHDQFDTKEKCEICKESDESEELLNGHEQGS